MKLKVFTLAVLISCISSVSRGQLIVDNTTTTAQAIALLLGPNVDFSNVTFSGATNQMGSFNSANANVGINSGIILATGDIQNALGPNTSGSSAMGGGNSGASDADLDLLDGLSHNDAAILEFDFVATGSSVSFQYVFASDEYPEFTGAGTCGDVSDVFGFFLSGPGIAGPFSNGGVNIALIPGTTQFVSIHNLNAGCDGLAPVGDTSCNYCEFYLYNGIGSDTPYNESNMYVQYDGLTVILTASHEGLECGETYHIKLALADVSDTAWDSAVFLKEGSFEVSGSFIEAIVVDPSEILGDTTLLEGCIQGNLIIHPPGCITDGLTVTIETSGITINGLDYEAIPSTLVLTGETVEIPIITIADNLVEGTESLIISLIYLNSDGVLDTATTSLNLLDYTAPSVVVENVYICGSTGVGTPEIDGGFAPFQYAWSSGQSTSTATYSTGDAGDYSLVVTDFCGSNFNTSFDVIEPAPFIVSPNMSVCYGIYSGSLARGGAVPYTVVYAEDSLTMFDYGFTSLFVGNYIITITDQCGSTGTVVIDSRVCETLVPNIFTPDGNGKNDFFHIFGLEGFPGSDLKIFNRWGMLVYEDKSYRNNWDGGDLEDGVFYYIFTRIDGKVFNGYVNKISSK